ITHKDISLNEYKDKIHTKLKEMKALQVELSVLNSNLASKNSELECIKNILTLKNSELELIKNNLAEKNLEIRFLETRLKELLLYNRLLSEQVKIGDKTDEKNDDNISVMQSLPKDLNSLSLAKYFIYKSKTENSQIDRDIQESLTQQTLTSLNDNMSKESEISNKNPEYIISKIKNNNIPIRKIEALPVVILDAGEALDKANKHIASHCQSHPASPIWPFRIIVTGKSRSDKTNILTNLFLDDKAKYIYKGKKDSKRYISCNDLIVCGYYPDEPKWAFIRYISYKDVSKIIHRYTDDVKNALMVINSYLCKNKFIVFDLKRPKDDLLAIRLRFDTSLDLQKEIKL
ncbi:24580_t:CDS:2, partial [Cetraspora pellucida]